MSYWLVSVDYGQIEARVLAMYSLDRNLVDSLWKNYDIHGDWADRWSSHYPEVLVRHGTRQKLREIVKNKWVFPLFYGSGVDNACYHMDCPRTVVEPLYHEFWDMFPGVKQWHEQINKLYDTLGYVECLTGRRRRHPLNHNQKINSGVQGTASDIVVDAQNRLSELAFDTEDWCFQPRLNIHDDLGFYISDSRLEECINIIVAYCLDSAYEFTKCVPLSVEVKIGKDWYQQDKLDTYYTPHEKLKYPF